MSASKQRSPGVKPGSIPAKLYRAIRHFDEVTPRDWMEAAGAPDAAQPPAWRQGVRRLYERGLVARRGRRGSYLYRHAKIAS